MIKTQFQKHFSGSKNCILLFIICTHFCQAQTILASKFDFDPKDATKCIVDAISSDYDTIIVDRQDSDWNVAPLKFKNLSNKTIIFMEGVVLKAIPLRFNDEHATLLELENATNINLIGYGAILTMNKNEYLDGEWRHGLSLRKCKNINVKGFVIKNSGGDGIYIAGKGNGSYSEDINIEDVSCNNNKRQGISIISAQNVYVKKSSFSWTNGTLPESGLDIEPNSSSDRIVNVNFQFCSFTKNNHSGILLALHNLKDSSLPVSIVFSDCYLRDNHDISNRYTPAEININADKEHPVKGKVVFERCFVDGSDWGMLYSRKRSDAFIVYFNECAARNISRNGTFAPIGFEVPDYKKTASLGGFVFNNLYLDYDTSLPPITVRGSRLGTLKSFKNTKGLITIKNKIQKPLEYINYNSKFNYDVNIRFVYIE